MSKTLHGLLTGYTYAVTTSAGCTVTDANTGAVLLVVEAEDHQGYYTATGPDITLSDDNALHTEVFKGAPAGNAKAGGTRFCVVQALPAVGRAGWIYLLPYSSVKESDRQNNYEEYAWIDGAWEKLGQRALDLSGYVTTAKLREHTGDTTAHVTAAERAAWNGKAAASDLSAHTGNATAHLTAAEHSGLTELLNNAGNGGGASVEEEQLLHASVGLDSLAAGPGAVAYCADSLAVGLGAVVGATYASKSKDATATRKNTGAESETNNTSDTYSSNSVAMGLHAQASGFKSTAYGNFATASGNYATASGHGSTARGYYATASGHGATASGSYATASGYNAKSISSGSTSIGENATASGDYSTAIGSNATASGDSAMASGVSATASGYHATAIGSNATASGDSAMASGVSATASGYHATAIGSNATASGDSAMASGVSATASGYHATASGISARASGFGSTTSGNYATASGDYATASGDSAMASGVSSTAIGAKSTASGVSSVAIGAGAYVNDAGVVAINAGGASGNGGTGYSTQLYLITKGSSLATTYLGGEAGLGYLVLDHVSGNIVERGVIPLASICTEHTSDFEPTGYANIKDY